MSLFLREHFGAARLMAANAFNLLSALWRAAVVPKWKAEEKAIFRLDLQSRLDRKYLDRKACTLLGYRQMERLQARVLVQPCKPKLVLLRSAACCIQQPSARCRRPATAVPREFPPVASCSTEATHSDITIFAEHLRGRFE